MAWFFLQPERNVYLQTVVDCMVNLPLRACMCEWSHRHRIPSWLNAVHRLITIVRFVWPPRQPLSPRSRLYSFTLLLVIEEPKADQADNDGHLYEMMMLLHSNTHYILHYNGRNIARIASKCIQPRYLYTQNILKTGTLDWGIYHVYNRSPGVWLLPCTRQKKNNNSNTHPAASKPAPTKVLHHRDPQQYCSLRVLWSRYGRLFGILCVCVLFDLILLRAEFVHGIYISIFFHLTANANSKPKFLFVIIFSKKIIQNCSEYLSACVA